MQFICLNTLQKKKEHLIRQLEVVTEEEDLPHEEFKEEDMLKEWNSFIVSIEIYQGL